MNRIELEHRKTFKFRDFLKNQLEITKKFPVKDDYFEKFDFKYLDLLLLQTTEELYEVLTSKTKDEEKKEIIDVLMYLGTSFVFIDYSDKKEEEFLKEKDIVLDDQKLNIDLDSFIKDLFLQIFSIRRLYPERKWHKTYDKSLINHEKRLNQTKFIIKNSIKEILKYLNENYTDFIDDLNEKENYCISL